MNRDSGMWVTGKLHKPWLTARRAPCFCRLSSSPPLKSPCPPTCRPSPLTNRPRTLSPPSIVSNFSNCSRLSSIHISPRTFTFNPRLFSQLPNLTLLNLPGNVCFRILQFSPLLISPPLSSAKAPSVRRACVACHTGKTRCSEVLPCQVYPHPLSLFSFLISSPSRAASSAVSVHPAPIQILMPKIITPNTTPLVTTTISHPLPFHTHLTPLL